MRNRWGVLPRTWALTVLVVAAVCVPGVAARTAKKRTARGGKVRTYYIAADEVEWDYAPTGIDQMMGMPFQGQAKFYMDHDTHRIGHVYKKAIYREYTDATFTTLKPRPPEEQYLGILGPILHAEVGDTIKVVFKNNGMHPYSIHPHGVFYEKASEGVAYNGDPSDRDEEGGHVEPGHTFTYTWEVPERAGPGPNDPSSIVWLYHSHTNELKDVNSGLIGAIIVTRRSMALPDGRPKNVDKEFVTLFMTFNENHSWFLDENIRRHTDYPAGTTKDGLSKATKLANLRYSINGMQYANLPMMTMKKGQHVRWYVVTIGELDLHTPHWHGNVVLDHGSRTDVISIEPAQGKTVDMVPDDPGIWLFHCHVSDHMEGGMSARYQVLP